MHGQSPLLAHSRPFVNRLGATLRHGLGEPRIKATTAEHS
jgi:hypothetical protein